MYKIPFPKKSELIELKIWDSFFKDLHKLAGDGFVFNLPGGEPLLHPHIFEIIKMASKNNLNPLLSTNGSLINKEIAEKLMTNGLYAVNISLDGSNKEIHDKIRGKKGAYEKVQKAIKLLDFFKKIYNPHFEIGIQSVIQKANINNIVDVVLFAENNSAISRINLNLLMQPMNTKKTNDWHENKFRHLWPNNVKERNNLFDRLIELKKNDKVSKLLNSITQLKSFNVYFKNPKKTPKLVKCNYDKAININNNGEVFLCWHYDSIGNIKDNNLIEMWSNKKTNNIRKQINSCSITDCWFRLNCLYSE